jgi:hypothetical protein
VSGVSYARTGSGAGFVTHRLRVCELVLFTCHMMCSLSMNNSMLFLLLRTTLLALTACVATVYGAPVNSDTQAMVRKFSLTFCNVFYCTCRIWDFHGDENSCCGLSTPSQLNAICGRCWYIATRSQYDTLTRSLQCKYVSSEHSITLSLDVLYSIHDR